MVFIVLGQRFLKQMPPPARGAFARRRMQDGKRPAAVFAADDQHDIRWAALPLPTFKLDRLPIVAALVMFEWLKYTGLEPEDPAHARRIPDYPQRQQSRLRPAPEPRRGI
jgi:hypothetical protein